MSTTRSALLATAYKLIDGFNAWDVDQIIGCRTADCVHEFYPPATPGAKGNNNDEARAHFLATKTAFTNFKVEVEEVVEDVQANKVVMIAHATMGTPKGGMVLDYVLLMEMDMDIGTGEKEGKIKRIVQMTQSKMVPA